MDSVFKTASAPEGTKGARVPLGGPPELESLVEQVHASQPFTVRVAAIDKITKLLDEYAVRNVRDLWAAASDLILPEKPDEMAEVGYKLLKACVALPGLTRLERIAFFLAACLRKDDSRFDLRLDIICTLTHGGRNIEACEAAIVPFILASLEACFKERHETRRTHHGKKNADERTRDEENMNRCFQYTIDVCRFNSKLFSDDDLELLLNQATTICQGTTQRTDMENCIRLFDTIITYIHIPRSALKPCLEVLCAIHRQITDLQELTWNTLTNLFKSHVGQAAVQSLLHTLLDGSNRKSHQWSIYRGAIQVLELLLLEDGRAGLPKVPISLLIPALKSSIQGEHKTQEAFVIGLIAATLAQENLRTLLLDEADWTDLLDIVRTCAGREEDRETAKGASKYGHADAVKATSGGGADSLKAGSFIAPI